MQSIHLILPVQNWGVPQSAYQFQKWIAERNAEVALNKTTGNDDPQSGSKTPTNMTGNDGSGGTAAAGANDNTDDMPPWTKDAVTVKGDNYGIKYESITNYNFKEHGGYLGSGMRIDIHYTGSLDGYSDVNWFQVCLATNGESTKGWHVDGPSPPYYYPEGTAFALRRNDNLDLSDAPNRGIENENYYFIAESSLIGFRDGEAHILASFVWGYINVEGNIYIIPPSPISPNNLY